MTMEAKIRRASLIIAAGLFLQFLTLLPLHPLAFIAFVGIGVPVMAIGVILFLLSLVSDMKPTIQLAISQTRPMVKPFDSR
jgi:hypothetical protein